MTNATDLAIELLPRYLDVCSDQWPIEVSPEPDELLSSWLHRLSIANGLAPRHFGNVLGQGGGMWSARLDNALPSATSRLLSHHCRIFSNKIDFRENKLRRLLLPLRYTGHRKRSTWLQYCPQCLADDVEPYFRRRWRLATTISCQVHGGRLRDRCPSCGHGVAAFGQPEPIAQHFCTICGYDLRAAPKTSVTVAARRLERCIHDICRFEAAKGRIGSNSLIARLLKMPTLADFDTSRTLTSLSSAARVQCFESAAEMPVIWLATDDCALTTEWRRHILKAGGIREALRPAQQWLAGNVIAEDESRHIKADIRGVTLSSLLDAYARIMKRASSFELQT